MLRTLAVSSAVAIALSGCASSKSNKSNKGDEFENLGRSEASSEPPAGILAPVLAGDLLAVQRRGKLLFDMERALWLAQEQGVARVGQPSDAVTLPIVDVDPGGKSAQVVFLQWPQKLGDPTARSADDAHRWLLVSMLLDPERILDVERLDGKVVRHTGEHVHAGAILEAAKQVEQLAPGRSFTMLSVLEQAETGGGLVTRVYAFAAEDEGPDVEIVVAPAKGKRGAPRLLSTHVPHPAGVADGERVTLDGLDQPAAMTVARVMWRGPDADPVLVQTRSGAWRVMPADGRVVRDAG